MSNVAQKILYFPDLAGAANLYKEGDTAIDSLIASQGIKRSSFFIPIESSKSPAQIDLIVIDERKQFNLRHVVTTVWHQNMVVGIHDQASPHLFLDIRFRMFGYGNETLPSHLTNLIGDNNGIPAHSFRHGDKNRGSKGLLFVHSGVESEISDTLKNVSHSIFHRLHQLDKLKHRKHITNLHSDQSLGGTL